MSTIPTSPHAQAITDLLTPLLGATVVDVFGLDHLDFGVTEVWPVLVLRQPDGTDVIVEVACDPEGNGPGHLFIRDLDE